VKEYILGPVFGKNGLFWYLDNNGKEEGPFVSYEQADEALCKAENRLNREEIDEKV
jgi:hypothetical protein